MARARREMTPSLLGSALLHGGLLVATLVSWPWLSKPMRMEAAVPVTIVSEAPVANIRPAEQAPIEDVAATEDPVPDATPEPAVPPPPVPQPVAKPPPPTPTPKAAQKPPPPTQTPKAAQKPTPQAPAPKKEQAQPKQPSLDLDALAKSLAPSRPAKPKSSAAKGRPRPETAAQARLAAGQASALAASALSALSADLARRWNPNCEVEGGADVDVRVAFRLNNAGQLVGGVEASGERSSDPVVKAASDRARRAVHAAAPFENLPEELYGERIVVRFNARQACATG